jgi:DNA-binding beta-propeller fold protein YncE
MPLRFPSAKLIEAGGAGIAAPRWCTPPALRRSPWTRFRAVLYALLTAALLADFAVAGDLNGPLLGFLPDTTHTVRPILGIPGAATLAAPLDLGADVSAIWISSRQNLALLATESAVRTASIAAAGANSITDAGLPPGFQPTAVAFSPSGATAALYDAEARSLWVLNSGSVESSILPAPIRILAVSDGSAPLIAGTVAGDVRSVFILDTQGNYRSIPGFNRVASVTFLGKTRDLAIADSGARQVLMVRDPLTGNAPEVLWTADADAPVAVASSVDGASLAVLMGNPLRAGRAVRGGARHPAGSVAGILNVASRQWISVQCACEATTLIPLRGNAVFRLTDAAGQPVWLLDGDAGQPRAAFVPAPGVEVQP